MLLTILLVIGELPKGSQFPNIEKNLPEAMKYNSLWDTKDAMMIREIKVLLIFMEASIRTWIARRPWLSLTIYNCLQSVDEFKADMNNLYIRVWKDPNKTWVKISFIATDDAIYKVMAA